MRDHFVIAAIFFTVVLSSPALAVDDFWNTDMDKAKASAGSENKKILIDFTGSDWCPFCKKLEDEVYSKPGFTNEVLKKFVPVQLDFPNDKTRIKPEQAEKNRQMAAAYDVEGYPTVIMTYPDGTEFARTGYAPGGMTNFLKVLIDELSKEEKRSALIDSASKAAGAERIKLLDQALEDVAGYYIAGRYRKYTDELIAFDKENKAGLKDKYSMILKNLEVKKMLKNKQSAKAIALCDEMENQFKPSGKKLQELYMLKVSAYFADANTKTNKTLILETLKKAKDAAPESPTAKNIQSAIDRLSK